MTDTPETLDTWLVKARRAGITLAMCFGGGAVGGGVSFFTMPLVADRLTKLEDDRFERAKADVARDLRLTALEAAQSGLRLEVYSQLSTINDKTSGIERAVSRIEGKLDQQDRQRRDP